MFEICNFACCMPYSGSTSYSLQKDFILKQVLYFKHTNLAKTEIQGRIITCDNLKNERTFCFKLINSQKHGVRNTKKAHIDLGIKGHAITIKAF